MFLGGLKVVKNCGFATDMGSTMTEDYDEEIETALIEPRFPQWYGITDHGTGMLMLAFQHGMPSVSIFFQLV